MDKNTQTYLNLWLGGLYYKSLFHWMCISSLIIVLLYCALSKFFHHVTIEILYSISLWYLNSFCWIHFKASFFTLLQCMPHLVSGLSCFVFNVLFFSLTYRFLLFAIKKQNMKMIVIKLYWQFLRHLLWLEFLQYFNQSYFS